MSHTKYFLTRIFSILVLGSIACGCKSMNRFEGASVGMTSEDVLLHYGAPEKIQKITKYEVWSYPEINSKSCQFLIKKDTLSQPVKCFFDASRIKDRELASKK